MDYIEGQTFDKRNFRERPLPKGEYENCTFNNCDFSNADLSDYRFDTCTFTNCNVSMVKLVKTALRDIRFTGCKMLAVFFETCNQLGLELSFDTCTLNHSCFFKLKLKTTKFTNCPLLEVDFTECDLTAVVFNNCDLSNAVFDHTNLEATDFRTAYNYKLDPEMNKLKKTKFSSTGIAGLLGRYDIEIE